MALIDGMLVTIQPGLPPTLYRYLEREEYARDFIAGKIYISTLSKCRSSEDAERGDSGEASFTSLLPETVSGGTDSQQAMEVARKLRIMVAPGAQVSFGAITRRVIVPDAYLLCLTTLSSSPNMTKGFGEFCVEIADCEQFFRMLTEGIEKITPLASAAYGQVRYVDTREHHMLDADPGAFAFNKPLKYQDQGEVRMLWVPKSGDKLSPAVLSLGDLANLVRRVS